MNEQQLLNYLAANPAVLRQLMAGAITEKASATTPGVIAPHGPNALFNVPGISPSIVSTIVQPRGLEEYLEQRGHVQRSMDLSPLFGILTGQTASSGSEPTNPCDENVPIAGDLKLCMQTWVFGEMTMKSKVIRVDNAGELINRSEPLDLRLINNPFADAEQVIPTSATDLFRNKLAKATVELTNDFKRRYARLIWTASPVNTASSTGGYLEFNGLERVVNTGYKDAITNLTCSAADSYVINRAGAIVQNTSAQTVTTYREAYRARKQLAEDVGLSGVEWAWVMRRQKFLAMVDIWPCAYETYRCSTAAPAGTTATVFVGSERATEMREQMLNGNYLLIDGEQVPVIIDNTMEELNVGGGNFQSDTYLLPMRGPGFENNQITYLDYFNYRGPNGMQDIISKLGPQDEYRVSPDGRFAIHFLSGVSFCKQLEIRTRKRIIVRAPFLAARIEDERYSVYVHDREWQPGTSFFENGGATSFFGETYQSPI